MWVAALWCQLYWCFSIIITKPLGKNVVDRNVMLGVKVSQFLVIIGVQAGSCGLLSLRGTIFRHCGVFIKQAQDKTRLTKPNRDLKEALAQRSNL